MNFRHSAWMVSELKKEGEYDTGPDVVFGHKVRSWCWPKRPVMAPTRPSCGALAEPTDDYRAKPPYFRFLLLPLASNMLPKNIRFAFLAIEKPPNFLS